MNTDEIVPIAVAVVSHRGRFLVGKRPPGVPLAGLWEFPGGKVEPGESPAEAAVRECLEETGLPVVVRSDFPPEVHDYRHATVRLHFFACAPASDRCEPQAPFRWVEREALADLEFPKGNRALLEHLLGETYREA